MHSDRKPNGGFLDLKTTLQLASERLNKIKAATKSTKSIPTVSKPTQTQDILKWQADCSLLWPKQLPVLSKQIFAPRQQTLDELI